MGFVAAFARVIKNLRTYYLRFPTGRGGRKDPMGRFRMPGPTRRTVDRKADAWSQFEPVRAGAGAGRGASIAADMSNSSSASDSSEDEPPAVGGAAGGAAAGDAGELPSEKPFRPFAGCHGSDGSPGSAARGRGGRGVSSACDCAARLFSEPAAGGSRRCGCGSRSSSSPSSSMDSAS